MKISFLCLINIILLLQISYTQTSDKIIDNKNQKTVVILLHLYNLKLIDEYIIRINRFVKLNNSYNFYIKINIPVSKNIEEFSKFNSGGNFIELAYKFCLTSTPYHPELITRDNCSTLYSISKYLWQKLIIQPHHIQIIFTENRGLDIGGFFLLLDQLIQSNLKHDYIVKLHTKTNAHWRNRLLAILNLDLKKYLPHFDCIYAYKKICYEDNGIESAQRKILKKILEYYNFAEKESFAFSGGTIFIASSKMTEFFKKYNRIDIFKQLNPGYISKRDQVEHGYERFFGYLMESLKLKTHYIK